MKVGDTFLWSPDGRPKKHLFIVMTDPTKNSGRFVVFNLTKSCGGPKALTFKVGRHPFITKYASDVAFGDGLITELLTIQAEIAAGKAVPRQPMRMEMVRSIAICAKKHPAVSGDIQKLIIGEWKL